jgi:hypothetical protein
MDATFTIEHIGEKHYCIEYVRKSPRESMVLVLAHIVVILQIWVVQYDWRVRWNYQECTGTGKGYSITHSHSEGHSEFVFS